MAGMNESGEWSLEMCSHKELAIWMFFFDPKDYHKKTWIKKVMTKCVGSQLMNDV